MLLFVYRSIIDGDAGAGHGVHSSWPRPAAWSRSWATIEHHRPVDVRGEPADDAGDRGGHRLRDLPASAAITRRRQAGEDRETAYYTMYHGTAHVILGSGLTIAGATFCLHFTRLPYFQIAGRPAGHRHAGRGAGGADPGRRRRSPIGSRFGLFEPKRKMNDPQVAPGRHGRGPLARTDSGRVDRAGAGRAARAADVQDQLQRPQLPARQTSRPTRATRPPTGTSRRPG